MVAHDVPMQALTESTVTMMEYDMMQFSAQALAHALSGTHQATALTQALAHAHDAC